MQRYFLVAKHTRHTRMSTPKKYNVASAIICNYSYSLYFSSVDMSDSLDPCCPYLKSLKEKMNVVVFLLLLIGFFHTVSAQSK